MASQPKKLQKGFAENLKERLDVLLVQRGLFPSREKAKAAIMSGIVTVDGQLSDKAGNMVDTGAVIALKENSCPYVSRGGLKLAKAMELWHIQLAGAVCMDIGASTGGFTDCMLQNGASLVYAVDVGYGQLDYKLRRDERVINMEKCNIRYIDKEQIKALDFISIDVSFISLRLVFPVAAELLKDGGSLVCLVKPQFEAGREQVGKKGIVRDKKVHVQVIENVIKYSIENELFPCGLTYSPVKGAKGNIEYLLMLRKKKGDDALALCTQGRAAIEKTVNSSHEELDRHEGSL